MAALTGTGVMGHSNSQSVTATAIAGSTPRFKCGMFSTDATVDATNTVAVDIYARYGIIKPLIVEMYAEGDTVGINIQETVLVTDFTFPTLTVTVPAGSDNDRRFVVVYGI